MALAVALAAGTGCGGAAATEPRTTAPRAETDAAPTSDVDEAPITLQMRWPVGMRWRTRTVYEQHVRATTGDRRGVVRREVTSTSTVLASSDAVVETHERLDGYQHLQNGQPVVDPELVAAIGSVFRMTWRNGMTAAWAHVSGAPLAGERVLYAGAFPGCPLPEGPVRVGDTWIGHDGSAEVIAMPLEGRLLEVDRRAGTVTLETRSESDALPDGRAARTTLRARCTVDLTSGFPRRLELDLVIQAARFDTVAHTETEREVL